MQIKISHQTLYKYGGSAMDSSNEIRLEPVSDDLQECTHFQLTVDPLAAIRIYRDFYLNRLRVFEVREPHQSLSILSQATVETREDQRDPGARPTTVKELQAALSPEELYDFTQASPYVPLIPEIWRLALDIRLEITDIWADSLAMMAYLYENFTYDSEATQVHTSLAEVLELKRGVCQDFTHALLGMLRSRYIPARYVSGYLHIPPPSPPEGAMHAWLDVYVLGTGWVGLDPTHNRRTDEHYIRVAVGRDYGDIRPVSGTYRGAPQREMEVRVSVVAEGDSALEIQTAKAE